MPPPTQRCHWCWAVCIFNQPCWREVSYNELTAQSHWLIRLSVGLWMWLWQTFSGEWIIVQEAVAWNCVAIIACMSATLMYTHWPDASWCVMDRGPKITLKGICQDCRFQSLPQCTARFMQMLYAYQCFQDIPCICNYSALSLNDVQENITTLKHSNYGIVTIWLKPRSGCIERLAFLKTHNQLQLLLFQH